jgi:hypothetical protein
LIIEDFAVAAVWLLASGQLLFISLTAWMQNSEESKINVYSFSDEWDHPGMM